MLWQSPWLAQTNHVKLTKSMHVQKQLNRLCVPESIVYGLFKDPLFRLSTAPLCNHLLSSTLDSSASFAKQYTSLALFSSIGALQFKCSCSSSSSDVCNLLHYSNLNDPLDDNGANEVYCSAMEAELSSVLLNTVNSLLGVGGPQHMHSMNVSL